MKAAWRARQWHPLAGVGVILALATVWRIAVAAQMPAISRDGVVFCWYAEALGERGADYLQDPAAQQHPLLPIMILGVQRAGQLVGSGDSPLDWQRCGQIVTFSAGLAVIVLVGVLARTLVVRLKLPLPPTPTMLIAMIATALLDLNVWLSVDVMADQVHAALYLGAVLLLLQLRSAGVALLVGVLTGLAFLTRQEGFMPLVAALTVLIAQRQMLGTRRLLLCGAAAVVGFIAIAGPYWAHVGRLSTKKDPLEWLHSDEAARGAPMRAHPTDTDVVCARLETRDLDWYALAPYASYKLIRAGRVIIPLLAVLPILQLGRRWLRPPLVGVATCALGQFALTLVLLDRYGYVATRHMLVVVLLLTPFAAMLLARLWQLFYELRWTWLGAAVVGGLLLPLALYGMRIPNSKDGHLRAVSHWVQQQASADARPPILGGSSTKRVAFYADLPWVAWSEDPDWTEELDALLEQAAGGYFVIEVVAGDSDADHFERAENRRVVERLAADPRWSQRLRLVHEVPGPDATATQVYAIARAAD